VALHGAMMSTKQANRQAITLKGSTDLVTEFFKYAVNTYANRSLFSLLQTKMLRTRILFQREVYPSDDFHMVKKYGQTVLVTQDLALENYLNKCGVHRLCLTIVLNKHFSSEFLHKLTVRE
jgi:mitotic spindle assembly checkpoint protein MAD2